MMDPTIIAIVDIVSTFACPGFQGDGVTCQFVGVCHIDNGGCHQLASCSETPGESRNTKIIIGRIKSKCLRY